VTIEDVCGSFDDIVGKEIISAEEVTQEGDADKYDNTSTWTFYKLWTIKGSVTIRWYGTSNGYYSESVDFHPIGDDDSDEYYGCCEIKGDYK
jgi:hypothetical protein